MSSRHLTRATRLYARARYRQALRLLEPEIITYQDSERYFLLLGLCCIRCRNIGEAITYLQRGQRLNEQNSDILQALAISTYMQNNNAESIAYLLTILEEQPKNRRAAEFLQHIRARFEKGDGGKGSAGSGISNMQPFLPVVPFLLRRIVMLLYIALGSIALAIVVIGLGVRVIRGAGEARGEQEARREQEVPEARREQEPQEVRSKPVAEDAPTAPARVGVEEVITARQAEQRIDYAAAPSSYVLNDEQVNDLLDTIEGEFLAGNDNRACVAINRILNSNAHAQVKQRMIFFSSYLIPPDFSSSFIGYSYQEVRAEPQLYNSCYVKWRGAVANITVREDDSRVSDFDFLVGYDSGNVLEGIVRSVSDVAYDFRINDAYEVIAQVRNAEGSDGLELYISDIRPLRDGQ